MVDANAILQELTALLGAAGVRSSASDLDRIARTTLPSGTRPVVAARPRTREQVQEMRRIAPAAEARARSRRCHRPWPLHLFGAERCAPPPPSQG